jgi:hypothetical protein
MPSSLSPRGTHDTGPEDGVAVPVPAAPGGFRKVAITVSDTPFVLKIAKAREQRMTGILLTSIGTAALLASTVVWSIAVGDPPKRDPSATSSIDPAFGFRVGGGVTIAVGVLFGIPGAILWGISDRRVQRLEPELKERILRRVQTQDAAADKAKLSPAPAAPPADDSVGRPADADVHDQPESGEARKQRRPTVGD